MPIHAAVETLRDLSAEVDARLLPVLMVLQGLNLMTAQMVAISSDGVQFKRLC